MILQVSTFEAWRVIHLRYESSRHQRRDSNAHLSGLEHRRAVHYTTLAQESESGVEPEYTI